jgi:hypothetical protein
MIREEDYCMLDGRFTKVASIEVLERNEQLVSA